MVSACLFCFIFLFSICGGISSGYRVLCPVIVSEGSLVLIFTGTRKCHIRRGTSGKRMLLGESGAGRITAEEGAMVGIALELLLVGKWGEGTI